MASTSPWFDQSRNRTIDYAFLAVSLTILAIESFYLLTGAPEKYPMQHWRMFLISCATSSGVLSRLPTRIAVKRSLSGLPVVALVALFAVMFR